MQLRLACWLLAALLLSAICCSAADDSKGVDTAALFNRINTTICSNNACPAGQYATSADAADCKRCPPGSYKAADGAGCCEKCQLPSTVTPDGTFAMLGATGCVLQCGHQQHRRHHLQHLPDRLLQHRRCHQRRLQYMRCQLLQPSLAMPCRHIQPR
ncbi:hypothetical protein COO60DRAFT_1674801 [Scenedesmus sp. NREL 46B-D3]|nr:hypothetical protein COO60DRAFT_1674801 [Scenedesmus sp. NREL 46B-D3]